VTLAFRTHTPTPLLFVRVFRVVRGSLPRLPHRSLFTVFCSAIPPTDHFCILRFDFCVLTTPTWFTSARCFSPPFCYTYPQSFRRGTDLCRRRPFLVTSHVLARGSRAVRCSGGLRDRSEMRVPPRAVRSEFGNRRSYDVHRFLPSFLTFPLPLPRRRQMRPCGVLCSLFNVPCSSFIALHSSLPPSCPALRSARTRIALGRGQSAEGLKARTHSQFHLSCATGQPNRPVLPRCATGQHRRPVPARNSQFLLLRSAFCLLRLNSLSFAAKRSEIVPCLARPAGRCA